MSPFWLGVILIDRQRIKFFRCTARAQSNFYDRAIIYIYLNIYSSDSPPRSNCTFPEDFVPKDTMTGEEPVNGVSVVTNGVGLQRNSNVDNGWIVQKFGGTSVGKFAVKIAEDVVGFSLPQS